MRRVSGALLACAAFFCASTLAGADTVAATTGASQLSAGSGWLLWSEPAGGAWRLVGLHDGAKVVVPVATRSEPFDVDVGTNTHGLPVATYTRCTAGRTPQSPPFLPTSGCTVRVLDLGSGRERSARIPRPRGDSDATPSMRRGRIAFSRLDPKHGQVMQVLLWDRADHRLTRLRHGPMPTGCPYRTSCAHEPRIGAVTAMDLGTRILTFTWHALAPGVAGTGGSSVVQAMSLRTRRSSTVGDGVSGEACTGGIDGGGPLNPTAVGTDTWYVELAGACEKTYAWAQRGSFGGKVGQADLPPTTIQGATDGRWLYFTVAPAPPPTPGRYSPPDYRCDVAGAPCVIEREPLPRTLRPLGRKPALATF